MVSTAHDVLVVHPSLPVKSVRELIVLAKARPGQLNYASGPAGGSPHLAGALFKAMAGIDIVLVSCKGGGPALNGLLSGEVQLTINGPIAVMTQVKAGN
jgi:tripartite-type tricarboxylate transporter receptor subunit TctC